MFLTAFALFALFMLATAPSRPPKPAPRIHQRDGFTVIYPKHRGRS